MMADRRPSIMDADIPPSALMAQDPTLGAAPPSSRPRGRTNSTAHGPMVDGELQETQNERAMQVLNRVRSSSVETSSRMRN
jgi:FKBP12-rapamycin complex-associated protein